MEHKYSHKYVKTEKITKWYQTLFDWKTIEAVKVMLKKAVLAKILNHTSMLLKTTIPKLKMTPQMISKFIKID